MAVYLRILVLSFCGFAFVLNPDLALFWGLALILWAGIPRLLCPFR